MLLWRKLGQESLDWPHLYPCVVAVTVVALEGCLRVYGYPLGIRTVTVSPLGTRTACTVIQRELCYRKSTTGKQ